MKTNQSIWKIAAGACFCFLLLPSFLHAQTSFSNNPDLTPVDLDKELEAVQSSERTGAQPEMVTGSAAVAAAKPKTPQVNVFAQSFYAAPSKKSETIATDVQGFTVMHTPSRKMGAEFAVVTDFGGEVVKTRYLKGLATIEDVNDYIQNNLETSEESGVEIRKLALPQGGPTLYWVGDKAYSTAQEASEAVVHVRDQVANTGGDFNQMVSDAQTPVEVEQGEYVTQFDRAYISNQKKEEDLMLKWADQMDLGEEIWGPLHGDPAGEQIVWQSFGETSYRSTNLEDNKFNSQIGYWTNRIVFKGIRFPMNTIDPFLEETLAMEAVPEDYKSHITYFAGLEWRPLARNQWLTNFRPLGNIKLLEFIRNYRGYIKYGSRYNIKDPIQAHDWDWLAGVQVFYEFGVELPDLQKPAPENFPEYLQEFVWGEYFADYYYQRTAFGTDKNDRSFVMGDSLILGFKLPGIPLPDNPINPEIALWPYMRFEHSWNDGHDFHYQNQYFISAGIRWMPFRTWRHKENEWLSKVKVFGEWLAVGKVQYAKTDVDEANEQFIRNDLRFGVSFASRRY